MLEKPDLADASIIEQLEAHYAIGIRGLEFLPVGNDQHAWAYRVEAECGRLLSQAAPRPNKAGVAARSSPFEVAWH